MLEIGELRTVLGSSADFFLGLFYGIFLAFRRFGLAVLSKIAIAGVGEGGVLVHQHILPASFAH